MTYPGHRSGGVAAGVSNDAAARAFLCRRSALTASAIAGLHQGRVAAASVGRLKRAAEAGAQLGRRVDPRGKSLLAIVLDPAFDWGAAHAPAREIALAGA